MPLYNEVIFAIMIVCNFTMLFKNRQVQKAQLHCTDVIAHLLEIFWSKLFVIIL